MPKDLGWIYVLMTSSDINRVKIGKTINNPLLRLRDLKTGDPNLTLEVAYFIPPNFGLNLKEVEELIHNDLANLRIFFLDDEDQKNKPSEWFRLYCKKAEETVDNAFSYHGFKITRDQLCLGSVKPNTAIKYKYEELRHEPCDLLSSVPQCNW